jgi:hypothetical protein
MGALSAATAVVIAASGLALKREVDLKEEGVDLEAVPEAVLQHLRERLISGDDVMAGDERRVVRRFRGEAGRFHYETVEIVGFEPSAVTFEHLRGPFAHCEERFDIEDRPTGCRITHRGSFSMRGGIWSWPFAALVVRPAFERHVSDHLHQLRTQVVAENLDPGLSPRGVPGPRPRGS